MSMYGDYMKEKRGLDIIEYPDGYITYMIDKEECYIEDIYVIPGKRMKNAGSEMANDVADIAKERGCKFLTGAVTTRFNDPTSGLKAMLAYGFKIDKIVPDIILLRMEI